MIPALVFIGFLMALGGLVTLIWWLNLPEPPPPQDESPRAVRRDLAALRLRLEELQEDIVDKENELRVAERKHARIASEADDKPVSIR